MLVEIYRLKTASGIDARATPSSSIAGKLLAEYLSNDIQGSVNQAREVLGHLEAVRTSREAEWTETGNAFNITANATNVVLDFLWANEGEVDTVEIALDAVQEAVEAWLVALERRP